MSQYCLDGNGVEAISRDDNVSFDDLTAGKRYCWCLSVLKNVQRTVSSAERLPLCVWDSTYIGHYIRFQLDLDRFTGPLLAGGHPLERIVEVDAMGEVKWLTVPLSYPSTHRIQV